MTFQPEPAPQDEQTNVIHNAGWTHATPFLAWIALMPALDYSPGWIYAARTVLCIGLLFYFCPWRWYAPLNVKNLPLAFGVGLLVFAVWVFPESAWMSRFPVVQEWYLRLGTIWPWELPDPVTETPYAPEVCGWPLTIMRLMGSAVAIAVIEEFFWRGFLYRWLQASNFLKVDLGVFHLSSFVLMAVFFGLEHQRWFVGALAGVAYGLMLIKTRDIWAVAIAHGITNFVLGLYVLATGSYAFW